MCHNPFWITEIIGVQILSRIEAAEDFCLSGPFLELNQERQHVPILDETNDFVFCYLGRLVHPSNEPERGVGKHLFSLIASSVEEDDVSEQRDVFVASEYSNLVFVERNSCDHTSQLHYIFLDFDQLPFLWLLSASRDRDS